MNHSPLILLAFLLAALFSLQACEEEKDTDVKDHLLEVKIDRIDSLMLAFGTAIRVQDSLQLWDAFGQYVKPEQAFFADYLLLPPQMTRSPHLRDSVMTVVLGQALRDSGLYALLDTVRGRFPYDLPLGDRIAAPLTRLTDIFPDVSIPRFTTHVNGYAPEGDWTQVDQVVSFPGVISFGLHYFMGKDWPYYPPGVYAYQRRRLEPELMDVALVEVISDEFVPQLPLTDPVPLVHHVVRAGIRQELMHRLLPYTPDSVLFRYTSDQMAWANTFESANYKFLMAHFFESDGKLYRDYIADKAFTSELSRESAPRLGEFIGWKMVQAYLQRHPEVTLPDLVAMTDYEKIMRESAYKP